MAYLNAFVTHFRAVQEWGRRAQASIDLDVLTFEMEVKCRGRYMHFHPQFIGTAAGRLVNTPALTPGTAGFVGWLPYRPLSYEIGSDKMRFKRLAESAGLRTPKMWDLQNAAPSPDRDYILKRAAGSFGYELSGPFAAGVRARREPPGHGPVFAEEFIPGLAVKIWYWGQRPFFAHIRQRPTVHGDGQSTTSELVNDRLKKVGLHFESLKDRLVIEDSLAFQGLSPEGVPAAGRSFFVDFRYGREYETPDTSLQSDNALQALSDTARKHAEMAGRCIAAVLRETLPAPVVYTLDAVLDESDQLWWLEANSNPALPPDGYKEMFLDLFGV